MNLIPRVEEDPFMEIQSVSIPENKSLAVEDKKIVVQPENLQKFTVKQAETKSL